MRFFLALAIASVTLLATSLSANALTFKSGDSKSFGKGASELESKEEVCLRYLDAPSPIEMP